MADPTHPLLRFPIFQHGWFVDDVVEAAHRWHRLVGAGPFYVTHGHVGDRHAYRGTPAPTAFDYAFGYSGETQVQLIAQRSDEASIYRDLFAAGQQGFHHVAMLVPDDDVEAEAARFDAAGFPVASSLWSHANVVYIDTTGALGCFVELHGDTPAIRAVFERWKHAHDTWDGVTDPVR